MSNEPNSGTLVLSQLRASLNGNRYSQKAIYAAVGISIGGAAAILISVLLVWRRLREVYAARPLLTRRRELFSQNCAHEEVLHPDIAVSSKSSMTDANLRSEQFIADADADQYAQSHISLKQSLNMAWTCSELEMLQSSGLDAVVYLRALRMTRNIFALLSLLLFCTAGPINIVFNLRQKYADALTRSDALTLLTPSLLSGTEMIPHVVLGWISNLVVLAVLWYNYRRVIALRRSVLSSPKYQLGICNRTIMLTDVPRRLRYYSVLTSVLAAAHPENESPESIFIGRRNKKIPELLIERRKKVRQYEQICCNGNLSLAEISMECDKKAREIEDLGNAIDKLRRVSTGALNNFAFASFSSVRSAHLLCGDNHNADLVTAEYVEIDGTGNCVGTDDGPRMQGISRLRIAPPPEQIVWQNLVLTTAERGSKQLIVNALYGILLLVWIIPSAFIGCFISNLSRLGTVWSAFGTAMASHPVAFAVLQGFLAPTITTAIFTTLPLLFRRLSHLQGKLTRVDREQEVLRKLYAFFFLDNFFLFTIVGVLWDIVAQVLQQTHAAKMIGEKLTFHDVWVSLRVAQRLATAIVNISSFWVVYLLRNILGLFGMAAQPKALIKRAYNNVTGNKQNMTAREKANDAMPQPFQYAVGFLNLLFNVTISLGFTTIQPLVLPITLVLFTLAVPIKQYELRLTLITKYESNGSFWPLVNDITLFAIGFGNLMLLCVVWVQAGWKVAVAATPLAGTVVVYKIVTYFYLDIPFQRMNLDFDDKEGNDITQTEDYRTDITCYNDPPMCSELEEPLLTFGEAVLQLSNGRET